MPSFLKKNIIACVVLPAVLLFVAFPFVSVIGQSSKSITIQGRVLDKENGSPLVSAHVYISQTKVGTATDRNGEFSFTTKMSGEKTLVVSFLGFKTNAKLIDLDEEKTPLTFIFEMEPNQFDLDQVNVSTSNKEWLNNFGKFRRYFIGDDALAQQTSIENPWSISFETDKNDNLVATASQPLIVKNDALGYEIEIDLVNFTLFKNEDASAYTYYSSFTEMSPEKSSDINSWNTNRERAYKGSFEHFLISLYNDNLRVNDFEVVYLGSFDPFTINEFIKTSPEENIESEQGVKVYRLEDPVDVLYGDKNDNFHQRERSRITPLTEVGVFIVTEDGKLKNPKSLRLDGVWASHLIANLLPIEYYKN
ncbi:carboxypeptidase-like regulatory domain-containing protein [Gracilimonas sp.]|uniref:carboxypeptidase-like regulatory domain-containing protein n=1 Tax=Gracilimonas sp. TaxID=1974203 RepID=UPI003D130C25